MAREEMHAFYAISAMQPDNAAHDIIPDFQSSWTI